MTNVRDPLINNNDQIYGKSKLKRRLNGERIPAVPETGRSLSSLKSFTFKLENHYLNILLPFIQLRVWYNKISR